MLKNKKIITVFGLAVFAVALVVALMAISQPDKQPDILGDTDNVLASNVTPNEIDDTQITTPKPEVKPSPIQTPEPTDNANPNDIPLTVIEDKPEPPELPDTAHHDDEDEPHEQPTDPALTNPDKKPDSTPKPAETSPPKDTTPQSGDKNGKGEVYIPGFGWVKDEGGGVQVEDSGSDGDWDKIIGH